MSDGALHRLSYTELLSLHGRVRRGELEWPLRRRLRCAVLAGFTTSPLLPLLDLFCRERGLACEFYEPPYGTWVQEVLDPSSATHALAPEVMLLLPGPEPVPARNLEKTDVAAWVEEAVSFWTALWDAARKPAGATVIQGTFVLPVGAPRGYVRGPHLPAPDALLARLNRRLLDAAGTGVLLHDTDALAASLGRAAWTDPRHWHHARMAVSFECLPALAHSLAASLAALCGLSRKALVVDLDNTLWGGVVGDLGPDRIEIGDTPVGEAHQDFQRCLRALQRDGVILAVCSRNDPGVAREPFEKRPEMVLHLDDFACFVAGPHTKTAAVQTIAEALHLGLDALVFVDDDPVERALIRQTLPEVAVVDLPEDPAFYSRALDEALLFVATSRTREDAGRAQSYRAEARREELRHQVLDVETFFHGLDMEAMVAPLSASDLPRAAQLIGRSNQFNLTGRRRSEAELEDLASQPHWMALAMRLRDRFGDYGMISVVLARIEDRVAVLDTWVMSCRVLARGVEKAMLAAIVDAGRPFSVERLDGVFKPSPRNGLVRDHYATLGFSPACTDEDGTTHWTLDLSERPPAAVPWIRLQTGAPDPRSQGQAHLAADPSWTLSPDISPDPEAEVNLAGPPAP